MKVFMSEVILVLFFCCCYLSNGLNEKELNGLISFYKESNGSNWTTKWDINKFTLNNSHIICNQYGIKCDANKHVISLDLIENNL